MAIYQVISEMYVTERLAEKWYESNATSGKYTPFRERYATVFQLSFPATHPIYWLKMILGQHLYNSK